MSAADPASLDDLEMQRRFREIVAEHKIKCIVETGVMHGLSTVILSEMVETVFAIDIEAENLRIAACNLQDNKRTNAVLCLGSSPWVLRSLAPVLPKETLYFLDAHYGLGDYKFNMPVLREIDVIRRGHGVIVIHDVRVPGRDEFEYRFFGKQNIDYELVRPSLLCWSSNHRVEYNSKCEGISKNLWRGAMYCFPS